MYGSDPILDFTQASMRAPSALNAAADAQFALARSNQHSTRTFQIPS